MFRDNEGCKEAGQEAVAEVVAWIRREVEVKARVMAIRYRSLGFKGGPGWRHVINLATIST